jgi:hypothetical protein
VRGGGTPACWVACCTSQPDTQPDTQASQGSSTGWTAPAPLYRHSWNAAHPTTYDFPQALTAHPTPGTFQATHLRS